MRRPIRKHHEPTIRISILRVLTGALVFFSLIATAQNPRRIPTIGVLWSGTQEDTKPYVTPFLEGLNELGWIDGKTAHIIVRYDDNDLSRLPVLAAALVSQKVDVLAVSASAFPAARKATSTIPGVVVDSFDSIAEGVTTSLARPSGNFTGVSWQQVEAANKLLDLARDLLPNLQRVVFLTDFTDVGAMAAAKGIQATAKRTGVKLRLFDLRKPEEAFSGTIDFHPDALIVGITSLTVSYRDQIVRFAFEHRFATISEAVDFAEAGFLLTYGANLDAIYRRAASQVDRILRGAKPSELPFEQPMKFDVAVNLKTAKFLNLKIPESIMVMATHVIR
jgi:putative tryptophan/tyrosine transport system substrate-binding protein